ncbi:MAG: HTTM domain-containing protein [Saprospiraceae bacterium]|nr:HTTM domain-containing protein [Saprospiraceae bacterium]
MSVVSKFRSYLSAPTHGYVLGLFRIVFGAFMTYLMIDYMQIDLVKNAFILPKIQLAYFDFLKPLPESVMDIMLLAMFFSAFAIMIGWAFRPACFVFGAFLFYFLMLDKGLFNNHLYLFVLLSFMLGFTHADRFFSLRNFLSKEKMANLRVPQWEVFIFQLHFAIVYFYGGLAKLNPDWLLRCEPVKSMIKAYPHDDLFAAWLNLGFQPTLLTYGGLLFDLAIPFLLWWKRTRWWSLVPLLFFHFSNSITFSDIGIFPFIMICSTVLYFDASELPVLKNMVAGKVKNVEVLSTPSWVQHFLVGYVAFQLLFPFRGLFLPNPVNWTMIANRFAWRMKSQSRFVDQFDYTVQDGPTGRATPVEVNTFVNPPQIQVAAHDPKAAADIAKGIAKEAKLYGVADPVVRARIRVRWNGYAPAYMVDTLLDLSRVEFSPFQNLDWVQPVPHEE